MDYLHIILIVGMVILGFLATYLKTKTTFLAKVVALIDEAETVFASSTKAGGEKFEYVVTAIMNVIPKPLQLILTRTIVSDLVQNTFDTVEAYAKKQLDKVIK